MFNLIYICQLDNKLDYEYFNEEEKKKNVVFFLKRYCESVSE